MPLMVSYDLRSGGDYSGLIAELRRSRAWWHHLESTWIVVSDESPDALWERLRSHFRQNDRCLITYIENGQRQGWLPQEAWEWLNHCYAAK